MDPSDYRLPDEHLRKEVDRVLSTTRKDAHANAEILTLMLSLMDKQVVDYAETKGNVRDMGKVLDKLHNSITGSESHGMKGMVVRVSELENKNDSITTEVAFLKTQVEALMELRKVISDHEKTQQEHERRISKYENRAWGIWKAIAIVCSAAVALGGLFAWVVNVLSKAQ